MRICIVPKYADEGGAHRLWCWSCYALNQVVGPCRLLGCLCSSSRLQHWLWLLYVPGIPEGSHGPLGEQVLDDWLKTGL
jgi:hypothetical protein